MWTKFSFSRAIASFPLISLIILTTSPCRADFLTLDRQSDENKAQVEFTFTFSDESDFDTILLRTDFYGQFYYKWIGAYMDLPINSAFPEEGDSNETLGNMQLGLFHVQRFSDMLSLVATLGVGLPTAGDDLSDVFTNASATIPRITDLNVVAVPDAVSLRPSLSLRFESELVFVRLDLGVDMVFPDDGDAGYLLRLNLGVGAHLGPVDLALELANMGNITEDDDPEYSADLSERFIHTLAVQASLPLPHVRPFIAYITALDDGIRGDVHSVSMGVTGTF